jgi:hypothetical protein
MRGKSMKPQLVIGLLVGLIVGYFAGREHIKYEKKRAAPLAGTSSRQTFSNVFSSGETIEGEGKGLEKQAIEYANSFLIFTNVTVRLKDRYRVGKVPWISGEIKNTGDKIIKRVRAVAFYLDENDAPVFENDFLPVFYSMMGDHGPLKPNDSCKFIESPEKYPPGWKEGSIKIVIKEIQFE